MSDDLVKRLREHIAVVIDDRGHVFENEALCDEAIDRIEALEAQVRAADALAEVMTQIANASSEMVWGEYEEVCHTLDRIEFLADAALAAYHATKEGGA